MHCFNENAIFVSANKHTMHIYDLINLHILRFFYADGCVELQPTF